MPALDVPYDDYRSSHIDKGEAYHRRFSGSSHRALLWRIEKHILSTLLIRHFPEPKDVRLLDFACGTGRILQLLEQDVAEAVGVDVAASMLEVAKRDLQKSRLICADITRADVLDGERFDLITAFRFFPNAEPTLRDEAMAKLASLLAPGGLLVFNNHLRHGSLRHRSILADERKGKLKKTKRLHVMSDRETADLIERHGLVEVECRHLGLLPVQNERKKLRNKKMAFRLERLLTRIPLAARFAGLKIHAVRARDQARC